MAGTASRRAFSEQFAGEVGVGSRAEEHDQLGDVVLEQEGLLARKVDPGDRRATLLELTPAGHQSVRHAAEVRDEIWEQALAALTPAERQQLVHLLSRLARGIEPACGSK